jgi:TctA family transporter
MNFLSSIVVVHTLAEMSDSQALGLPYGDMTAMATTAISLVIPQM